MRGIVIEQIYGKTRETLLLLNTNYYPANVTGTIAKHPSRNDYKRCQGRTPRDLSLSPSYNSSHILTNSPTKPPNRLK